MGSRYPRLIQVINATGVLRSIVSREHTVKVKIFSEKDTEVHPSSFTAKPASMPTPNRITSSRILHRNPIINFANTILKRETGKARISLITLSEYSLPKIQTRTFRAQRHPEQE